MDFAFITKGDSLDTFLNRLCSIFYFCQKIIMLRTYLELEISKLKILVKEIYSCQESNLGPWTLQLNPSPLNYEVFYNILKKILYKRNTYVSSDEWTRTFLKSKATATWAREYVLFDFSVSHISWRDAWIVKIQIWIRLQNIISVSVISV